MFLRIFSILFTSTRIGDLFFHWLVPRCLMDWMIPYRQLWVDVNIFPYHSRVLVLLSNWVAACPGTPTYVERHRPLPSFPPFFMNVVLLCHRRATAHLEIDFQYFYSRANLPNYFNYHCLAGRHLCNLPKLTRWIRDSVAGNANMYIKTYINW